MNSDNCPVPTIEIIPFDPEEQKADGRKKTKVQQEEGKGKELTSDEYMSSEDSASVPEIAREAYKAYLAIEEDIRASKQQIENKKSESEILEVEGYKGQKRKNEENVEDDVKSITSAESLGDRVLEPIVMDERVRKLFNDSMIERRKNHREVLAVIQKNNSEQMDILKATYDVSKAIHDELVKLNQNLNNK